MTPFPPDAAVDQLAVHFAAAQERVYPKLPEPERELYRQFARTALASLQPLLQGEAERRLTRAERLIEREIEVEREIGSIATRQFCERVLAELRAVVTQPPLPDSTRTRLREIALAVEQTRVYEGDPFDAELLRDLADKGGSE